MMKKALTFLTAGLAGLLFWASLAFAGEVNTENFSLSLPSGWELAQPVQSSHGASMVMVQNTAAQCAVSIALFPISLSAADLASQTLANMKVGGFTVAEPRASGDSYLCEFSQDQTKGICYFTSNGKSGSVVTIVGSGMEAAKELLNKHFRPTAPGLFPASF